VNYREASLQDIDALLAIEQQSFRSPWSRTMFEKELALQFSYNRVAELKKERELAGYIFCWLAPPEASIMSIAVKPEQRRRGMGTYLLGKTLEDLKAMAVREVFLEVRPSNFSARSLYQRFGFFELGVRPRYYQDSGEDAIVMKKEL